MRLKLARKLLTILLCGSVLPAQDASERLRSLVDRAQTAEKQNRLDEAVSLYDEILRLRPGWASAELNLGLVHHSRADYSKAIQLLTKALQHNPDLHSALLFRGASYYSTGRFEEAVRDLRQYLQHDPENAEALSWVADAQLARNDLAEAALAYLLLARTTSQPAAYFHLSECYVQLAGRAMALLSGDAGQPYWRRIVEAERSAESEPCEVPGDPELTQARCGADRGEFEPATRTLMRIAQGREMAPQAIYWSVGAYQRLAKAAIAKVITLAPESSWAALLRARAAEQSGQIETAEKEYERATQAPQAGVESYVRSGQFQAKQNRLDQALTLYERALALEPENPRVMGLAGEVHVLEDRAEQAVPLLERALKANPRETQTRLYLAQALVRLGRGPRAIQVLESAPEDHDGRVHYLLSRTYQQQGAVEKARRAMDEYRKRRKAVNP